MRKILLIALLSLIAGVYTCNAYAQQYVVKTTSTLNVRKGPGSNYRVIGSLKNGTTVNVEGFENTWAYFTYKGGTRGYVAQQFLVTATPTSNYSSSSSSNFMNRFSTSINSFWKNLFYTINSNSWIVMIIIYLIFPCILFFIFTYLPYMLLSQSRKISNGMFTFLSVIIALACFFLMGVHFFADNFFGGLWMQIALISLAAIRHSAILDYRCFNCRAMDSDLIDRTEPDITQTDKYECIEYNNREYRRKVSTSFTSRWQEQRQCNECDSTWWINKSKDH